MFNLITRKMEMIRADEALEGRAEPIPTAARHFVFDRPLESGIPEGHEQAMFGMGCFWGVERMYWNLPGVWLTMAGYAGGFTPNPTYSEVCTGKTGHNEVVRVIFDPDRITYEDLLKTFWEGHDPTQGMRQGNDRGTQYRSGIYTFGANQFRAAQASQAVFQHRLSKHGLGNVTTEILEAPAFYFAEADHQQYLAKNPGGYCGLGGTGVTCPIGTGV